MFIKQLKQRSLLQKERGLYRKPVEIDRREGKYIYVRNKKVLNMASNDYLGLGVSKDLSKKVAENFLKYSSSSSSSRLVSGNYSIINEAERAYAHYFGYPDALFFPSGYQANLGLLSAFFRRDDTLIYDKHIHASSIKGMVMSGASFKGFNHNSMTHLRKRLAKHSPRQAAVLTESLFSMDGDLLDIKAIKSLKDEFGFFSLIDEAHAFGAIGNKGRGIAREAADVALGTFGKAMGLFGAFALLPEGCKEYLYNFSSPLIYSTTLPEAHAASALDLLEIIEKYDSQRRYLSDISLFSRDHLTNYGLQIDGKAHVLAIRIGKEEQAVEASEILLKKGFFLLPARYPTVPQGKAILRLGMNALITEEDIKRFISAIKETFCDLIKIQVED